MQDMNLNIFNRASFVDKNFQFTLSLEPHGAKTHVLEFKKQFFALKKADWKYSVDHNDPRVQLQGYGHPRSPIQVTIDPVLENEISPGEINPPAVFEGKLAFLARNPSNIPVVLVVDVFGTLVKPVGNNPRLSAKEVLGCVLLDNNQRGMLALTEAYIDTLPHHQAALPGGSSHLPALDNQSNPFLPGPGGTPLALPDVTESKSALIGDIVCSEVPLELEQIKALAEHLSKLGWVKTKKAAS